MTYEFKPSSAENVDKQVFIALAGTTGSGKTESAMRIAKGIVGDSGKFVVIDTEHKRALNKKSRYDFDHLDLQPPYSPANFKGAIDAATKAGYKAIIIDNFSHEWFGEGGCSDIQEEALDRLSGGDARKAERLTALAWKQPKQEHKKLMNRIVQQSVPLIFCLRAEPKIKFQKDPQGRTQVVDAGWQPIAEKMFAYEMLIYALLMPEDPGVPSQLKKLEPELESVFLLDHQITEEVGKRLAIWANSSNGNGNIDPAVKEAGQDAAMSGVEGYTAWLATLTPEVKTTVKPYHSAWSKTAKEADANVALGDVSEPNTRPADTDEAAEKTAVEAETTTRSPGHYKADYLIALREIEKDDPERVAIALDGRDPEKLSAGQIKDLVNELQA